MKFRRKMALKMDVFNKGLWSLFHSVGLVEMGEEIWVCNVIYYIATIIEGEKHG
jgi:hypothetical protein